MTKEDLKELAQLPPADQQVINSIGRQRRLAKVAQVDRGAKLERGSAVVFNDRRVLSLMYPRQRRTELPNISWYAPGSAARKAAQDGIIERPVDGKVSSEVAYKIANKFRSKVEVETDLMNGYWGWHGIIYPEYDLLEPFTIVDTESFYKEALERKLSLMFREGFAIVGDNSNWVEYIETRLDQMAFVTENSTVNLFKDILWNLLVCSNCVLVKMRDSAASGGKASDKNGNMVPVAGYIICPPHTIFPYMDGAGRIIKWRRFFGDARPWRDYDPEDIVHFYWKRKPGHIFGTPDAAAVRDDIFALRRLEENVELLMANCLFPFVHVAVGTETNPAEYLPDGRSEVDVYRADIASMPKEGIFVTDERVKVTVYPMNKGAAYEQILQHYKSRVFTGLGVSAVDMGESDTASRSAADTVSQNLKDKIKAELGWFCEQAKYKILKGLFQEAPFQLSVQKAVKDVSVEFHEIDAESKIKNETHAINTFNQNGITQTELRRTLKRKPLTEEQKNDTNHKLHVESLIKEKAKASGGGKLAKKKSAKKKTASAKTKATKTKVQPTNQHKTNTGPHKAKSSVEEIAGLLYDGMMEVRTLLEEEGNLDSTSWREYSSGAIDILLDGLSIPPDSVAIRTLKNNVLSSFDPDVLLIMIADSVSDWEVVMDQAA